MFRFILFLALFAALSTPTLSAQKVKKLKTHEIQLDQLPLEPLGGYFRTYSLKFDNFDAIRKLTGKPEKKMNKDYFNLNNYRFADQQGDFQAEISLGNNLTPARTTATKVVQAGTREAPVQDTQSYYNVSLQLPLSMQLTDGDRKLIREVDLSGFIQEMNFEFGPYGTDAELAARWRAEGEKVSRVNTVKYLDQAFNYAASRLRSEVDSIVVKRRVNFVTIKKAEKYGIGELATDAEAATEALEAYAKGGSRSALTEAMRPLVKKWRGQADKYDPKNKKERDIRYAYGHNLALAAFLTGELDAAEEGIKAGFDWGKNSTWYADLRRVVNVDNARKRHANRKWKPTPYTDVYQPRKPKFRRLKVYDSFTGEKEAYVVSKDTTYTDFDFFQVKKGKAMAKIGIMSDTKFHNYNPLQMRAIYDGEFFYEAIPAPTASNLGFNWKVAKIVENLGGGAVKVGQLVRGKSKKGEPDTQPAEYYLYGSKVRRPVNLTGTAFATDFNAGVLEFFGAEYPAVAIKARAKAYQNTPDGYKLLAADLAAGK